MSLLSGQHKKVDIELLYSGEFRIKSLKNAEETMQKMSLIKPYYDGYNRRCFIYAMMSMFKNPNFDFSVFLQKLKLQPTVLRDCAKISQYKELIEDIYNYRRKDKINLRF